MHIQNMREFVRTIASRELGGRPDQTRNENGQFADEGGGWGSRGVRGHIEEGMRSDIISNIERDVGVDRNRAEDIYESTKNYTGGKYDIVRAYQQDGINGIKRVRELNHYDNVDIGSLTDMEKEARQMEHDDAVSLEKEAKSISDNIELYIKKSPKYEGTIYRGIWIGKDNASLKFQAGDEIDMKGTSSWSSNKDIAKKASVGGVVFIANNVEKSTSIRHLSIFHVEDEVVVSKEAKFKVKNVIVNKDEGFNNKGLTYVEVEEVK